MKNDPRQEEIIQEFELLGGDAEMMITYLIELGQKAPAMSEEDRRYFSERLSIESVASRLAGGKQFML